MQNESIQDDHEKDCAERAAVSNDEVQPGEENECLARHHGHPAWSSAVSSRGSCRVERMGCYSPTSINGSTASHVAPTRNFSIKPRACNVQPHELIRSDQKYKPFRLRKV